MIGSTDNPIIVLVSRTVSPFIQLFALYVIFHGHYGPGGGFQGGAMLAASIILMRLSAGETLTQLRFRKHWGIPLGSLGTLIYAGTGLVCLIWGGPFLDYAFLPIPGPDAADLRSLGILFIEVGVGIAVMATLVAIYDDLREGKDSA